MERILKLQYETRRRIEFADTDMAGISHFTNFFRLMEEAEHEFLRSLGLDVVLIDQRGKLGFPKLLAHCEFKQPALYGDELHILVTAEIRDGKTIKYAFEMLRDDRAIATGQIHVACCRFPSDSLPFPVPLPDRVLRSFGAPN